MQCKNPLFLAILSLTPLVAFSANNQDRDLSTGIAFPSGNSATFENGAALTEPSHAIEGLVGLEGGSFLGTYTGGGSSLGFGIGGQRVGDQFSVLGGLGFGLGNFSLGVDAEYNFDSSSFSLDAGIITNIGSNTRFAFVVTDLTGGVDSLTAGLGYQANPFQLEADLRYDISPETWTLLPAFMIQAAGNKLSFMLGLAIPLSGGTTQVRVGFSFWIAQNFMLEYLHEVFLEKHVLGLKFRL